MPEIVEADIRETGPLEEWLVGAIDDVLSGLPVADANASPLACHSEPVRSFLHTAPLSVPIHPTTESYSTCC